MRILIAPDSFKESLSALAAAEAIARGVKEVNGSISVDLCPMADGGEGSLHAIASATGGTFQSLSVVNAMGKPCEAQWVLFNDGRSAFIEMAEAAGLEAVPVDSRNPMLMTSYGVGQLIRDALDNEVEDITVGLGGSATCDGGVGLLQALGARFKGASSPYLRACDLENIEEADFSQLDLRLKTVRLVAACDVSNPLLGASGSAAIFGPQKGADEEMVKTLDAGLSLFAQLCEATGAKASDLPGAGAAGGLGYAVACVLHGELESGIKIVIDQTGFKERLQQADLVITGEGRLDGQSMQGKTCYGIARLGQSLSKPVFVIAGSVDITSRSAFSKAGMTGVFSLCNGPISLEEAKENAAELLASCSGQILSVYMSSLT